MRKTIVSIVSTAALFCLVAVALQVVGEEPTKNASPDAGRLDVSAVFGQDAGGLTSQKRLADGRMALHGMQVILGPNNWMKEYSVFNEGVFEQRTQFYPSGKIFRVQRREHNGDGSDVIYTAESNKVVAQSVKVEGGVDIGPIKVQSEICQGLVKGDQPWQGGFLVREPIPNGYGLRLRIHEYREGKLVKSEPFPVELLKLPKDKSDEVHWLWSFPEWPKVATAPRTP